MYVYVYQGVQLYVSLSRRRAYPSGFMQVCYTFRVSECVPTVWWICRSLCLWIGASVICCVSVSMDLCVCLLIMIMIMIMRFFTTHCRIKINYNVFTLRLRKKH